MKNLFPAILLFVILAACSSTSNDSMKETPTQFDVNLKPSSLTLDVDETAVVKVESENSLSEVKWVRENGSVSISAFDGEKLDTGLQLYFQFPFPGTFPVNLEFKDSNGKTISEKLTFEVLAGNTVQITKIEVLSFYDMGKEWDPEATGEEKLADIVWALEKPRQVGFSKDELRTGNWFVSEVHTNESSLTWDLENQNLYFNPMFMPDFGLADVDEGGLGQNLLLDRPSYKIDLRNMLAEKPASFTLIDEKVDLHIVFSLKWP